MVCYLLLQVQLRGKIVPPYLPNIAMWDFKNTNRETRQVSDGSRRQCHLRQLTIFITPLLFQPANY